jgi:hypothetical protein
MPIEMFIGVLGTIITASILWAAKSLHDLNIRIAVIVEKVARHDDLIADHSERIRDIELNQTI